MRRNVFDDDFEPKPEVKKQLRSERLANPEQLTAFSAVGSVIEIMKDSALAAEYLQMAEPYLDFLAKQQQITTSQAMILSLFLEHYYDHHLTNEDLFGSDVVSIVDRRGIMPPTRWRMPCRTSSCRRWKRSTAFSLQPAA